MFPARVLLLGLALMGSAVDQTLARSLPPGKYHEQGRIVLKANGELAVFSGTYGYLFPKPLQEHLRSYIGKFVDVEYTRIADQPGMISMLGSKVGDITNVTVKAEDPAHLPIACKVTPTKTVYDLSEPIVVHVSVTNDTDEPQELGLGTGETISLCQDYERKLSLDWLEEYYSNVPARGLSKGIPQHGKLAAGQTIEFDVTSQYMVRPDTYQVVYKTYGGPATDYGNQSEVATITIADAKDAEAEHRALRTWLYRAAFPQRVEIAEELLRFHDEAGTQEIFHLLGMGVYSKASHWYPQIYRYVWKYGGKEGEKVMLDLIESQQRQGVVDHLIEDIGWSPDHLELLDELLACKNAVFTDTDSWIRTPRICDITATYLRGYPWDVTIKFPKKGTEEERDKAVEEVKKMLHENSKALHIPTEIYWEERTLGAADHVNSKAD